MSHIFYEFDDELDTDAGLKVGNGWRLLASRVSNDGTRRYRVMWNPATDERLVYISGAKRKKVSNLLPRQGGKS